MKRVRCSLLGHQWRIRPRWASSALSSNDPSHYCRRCGKLGRVWLKLGYPSVEAIDRCGSISNGMRDDSA